MDPFVVGILGVFTLLLLLAASVHIGAGLGIVGALGLLIIIGFEGSKAAIVSSVSLYSI